MSSVTPATELSNRTRPMKWTVATAAQLIDETPHTRTIVLALDEWPGHRPGQHLDVRLTAEDGYQQERSYSIASAPEDERVAITVDRIDDGAVSPYLAGDMQTGDQFEIRGPIGGYFVWDVEVGGPVLLVGGGSGLVPLMAMVRHRIARRSSADVRLLASARSADRLIYREELARVAAEPGLTIAVALTRAQPPDWQGYARRVDAAMLEEIAPSSLSGLQAFICGPNSFVESVAQLLVGRGLEPARIRTERFGPTGT